MIKNIKKRTILIAGILILIIAATNPGLIPFLPVNVKLQILQSLNNLLVT